MIEQPAAQNGSDNDQPVAAVTPNCDTPPAHPGLSVELLNDDNAPSLLMLTLTREFSYNDFASLVETRPENARVWIAREGDGKVIAAAIDDGMALAVAGSPSALRVLETHIPHVTNKLLISGRAGEGDALAAAHLPNRRLRAEALMSVSTSDLIDMGPPVELRVANGNDLPLLMLARVAALEEEYGITIPTNSRLRDELANAVRRAVEMQGVAIWLEAGRIAFTAQLISKTPQAAMFGDLFTDPALRGQGRATRALSSFCRWLMVESQHVILRVGCDNDPAVRLYERVGFRKVDDFVSSLRDETAPFAAPDNDEGEST